MLQNNLTRVARLLTADMSSSMGLCQRNEAVFTYPEMSHEGGKKYDGTHGVDELDACEVHIILCILVDQLVIMD